MTDADYDAAAQRVAGQTMKLAGDLGVQRAAANQHLSESPHLRLVDYLDREQQPEPDRAA